MQQVVNHTGRLGTVLVVLVAAVIAAYVAVKWGERQRFLRSLRVSRMSQDELKRDLDAGIPAFVVDLRSALDVTAAPFVIPGAVRIVPDELERRHRDIPRDWDIVVYCS